MKRSFYALLPGTLPTRFFIPVLLTMFLFIGTFFGYILPKMEEHLMDRKREMIHALSESAMSTIRYFASLAERGVMSDDEARRRAIDLVRNLRYGPEGKDYFWINDTHPRMIMHPYRADLEGQDVSETMDTTGFKVFQAFLLVVKERGGGYVNYHWQWQDDPNRIFSKISYVQEFSPWHWIVGTGVYVEDVRSQIAVITKRMTFIFLGILGLLALISVYVVWQGVRSEQNHQMMEESLRLSENRYRLLAETAREIILLFDADLNIVYGNSAWKRISGYDDITIADKRLADLVPPVLRGELFDCISRLEDDRLQDFLLETQFILSDLRTIVVEATFAKMTAAGERETYLLTARDITERKKIEAQAKMHQEQLMQTNKMVSLGTLVSGVAHEINNPISSVMLNLQVFEKFWRAAESVLDRHHEQTGDFAVGGMMYPQLRDRMPQLLHFSLEGAARIKRIVGDLKDFSGQRPSDRRETVNLNQEVEKAVGMVSSLIKKATSNFRLELDDNLPTLQGNSQRLGQVIINLLVNACQALSQRSQEVQITTGYIEESEEIVLEVRDGGCGMPAEVLARIKDPFFTTRRDSGGTGLGLSISDTIIRNHGGWLVFASTPGQGTVATVSLPRYGPEDVTGRMI